MDSENEENGEESVESESILFAKARIAAEHDTISEIFEGQIIPGTEFKAFGRIRGIAPDDDYNGYWSISLKAWNDSLNIPEMGVNKWEGDYEYEKEEKDKDKFTKLKPLADFLSRRTATASITGGDRLHYWSEQYFYGQPPQEPDKTHAFADDFSHADADEWVCYNCTTPDDELDTPCSKCGGEDRKGGVRIEDLTPIPSPDPTPAPDPTPDTDDIPDTDDEDTNNGGAVNIPSPGLSPTNGSNLAVGGETYELQLVAEENYYYVHWYVKSPSETGIGTEIEYDGDGFGGESEASFSYTTGDYVITARVYRFSDYTYYDETYTVTVW